MTDFKLDYADGALLLPVTEATEGPGGLGIGKLLGTTGHVTLDSGFVNTASCTSSVTYIDGDAGILRYRGYPIAELAEKSTFLETAYLLIYGELPSKEELTTFTAKIADHAILPEGLVKLLDAFPKDAHPMMVLSSAVNALATYYQDELDPFDTDAVELTTIRLMAQLPTIAAHIFKNAADKPNLYPDTSLGYVENFLRLTFGLPSAPYEIDPVAARTLDMLLILHGDHEQNCSTSTVRLVGSSNANLYASIASGVNALSGPLHGGANQAVLEMLASIHGSGDNIQDFVQRVKDKEPGVKLMGFGHRVYKNFDPRSVIVKGAARQVLTGLDRPDPLLDLALQLEEIALADDYFVSRKLYPNVDFYTGLIYKAMGFPPEFFTVLFALGRLPGWIAQWREMITDPATKIGRPRQVYIGEAERHYPA